MKMTTPSKTQIKDAVHRAGVAGIRELCQALWPTLPWLPKVPGEDNARGTTWCWSITPPTADGRSSWEASCAEWLWRELEDLIRAGKVERAAEGGASIVDALSTARYRAPTVLREELHRTQDDDAPPPRRRRPPRDYEAPRRGAER